MNQFDLLRAIRVNVEMLAGGNFNDLPDAEYEKLATEADDLSSYLGSVAESYRIAASPECAALLAACCEQLSKTEPGRKKQTP